MDDESWIMFSEELPPPNDRWFLAQMRNPRTKMIGMLYVKFNAFRRGYIDHHEDALVNRKIVCWRELNAEEEAYRVAHPNAMSPDRSV